MQVAYRTDIDGLRAISVLSVVAFHMDLQVSPGGFVGVDVFFVISGFLISRYIYDGLLGGTFSVFKFYERRSRRILPAFFFVSFLVFLFAYTIFLPKSFADFSESLIYSILFSGNIYFWLNSDYFSPAADTQPLLHYWSLGVEEQFYFVFPLAMWLASKLGRNGLPVAVVSLALLSLAASEFVVRSSPVDAFYLLPYRAWEMLLGSIVALPAKFPKSALVGAVASAVGVAMIVSAVLLYSPEMRFPGFAALLPTMGAALVLWGGEQRNNPVAASLGVRPLRYFGLISYSLYLTHWPVIVFAGYLYPKYLYADNWFRGMCLFGVSWLIADVSYRLIEKPTRNRSGFWRTWRLVPALALIWGAAVVGTCVVIATDGLPWRLPADVRMTLAYQQYDISAAYRSRTCFMDIEQKWADLQPECIPSKGPVVLLWGDSFAAHLLPGLLVPARQHGLGLAQMTASACSPIIGYARPDRPNCLEFNDQAMAWIRSNRPQIVILSAIWSTNLEQLALLDATIDDILAAGGRPVIVGQGPSYVRPVPEIIAERQLRGDTNRRSQLELQRNVLAADVAYKAHFKATPERYVSLLDALCDSQGCPLTVDGEPVYWDYGHLTIPGSRLVTSAVDGQLFR